MTVHELKAIFPGATVLPERFGGIVKSWTVIGGFPCRRNSWGTRD